MSDPPRRLAVRSRETVDGLALGIDGREFAITFPPEIWERATPTLRQALREHLVFGNAHVLPLLLGADGIDFDVPPPVHASALVHNQLLDLTACEHIDGVAPASYLRAFHNLDLRFAPGEGALPAPADWPQPDERAPTCIVPFSFGKESLVTVGLCLELGIRPVLVYVQEPAHPHEEAFKRRALEAIGREFGVPVHFVGNEPGLFRYGRAFEGVRPTELGWGTQTTLLALMMVPFAQAYGAQSIWFGNEHANNETGLRDGWVVHYSVDQSSAWTRQQNSLIRALTGGRTRVESSLESLEEIHIFHMLHRRYPRLARFQFSCSAEQPLVQDSPWCHRCHKCARMYLFASGCGLDPAALGFRADLLDGPDLFPHYFGPTYKSGFRLELDFAFYLLYLRGAPTPLRARFERDTLPTLASWTWFRHEFTTIRPALNLPERYRDRMLAIFDEAMASFRTILPDAP